MDISLGLLEVKTLTRGLTAADAMLKEAPITLLWTRAVEPGRMLVLIRGTVDDVRHALRRGRGAAGDDVHDEMFLPMPHPDLLHALQHPPPPTHGESLGLIECASVGSTLLAADAVAKQADVHLLALRLGADMHGKGLVAFAGEVSEVESALTRGAAIAEDRGMLLRAVVIPEAEAKLFDAVRKI
jgi:microcompartment protein CcmL/EutN